VTPRRRQACGIGCGLAFATALALSGADAPVRVLVLHKKASTLGLYDSLTGARIWVAPVGSKPHEMVLSPGDRYAYVTDYGVDSYNDTAEGGRTISIVDLDAGVRAATIDLGRFRRPHGIALGFSGRAYITVDHPAAVLEVDVEARRVAAEHLLDQALPHMVTVSKDERYLYTANAGAGTISAIDRRPGGATRSTRVGGVPMGLALSRDGDRLYVATRDQNTVALVATSDLTVIRQIPVAGSPARLRLMPNDQFLLVTLIGSGELAVLDTATEKEVARFLVGNAAEGITVDTRTGFGYASAQAANKVVKFSLTDWRPVLEIATDASPDPVEVLQLRSPR
jgi:YVTN family beta-propeller protein